MIKVLVIGAGFMGRLHALTVRSSRNANLCGVVDQSERVADAVGAELRVAAFTDVERAIEETSPDAAIIATPDPFHRRPTETAIEAGLSVLVEKPLAMSVEDADAIVRLARERGVRLMTGHIGRFYPRYVLVAEAVQSGNLGRPVMVTTSTWGPKSVGARLSQLTDPLWHFAIHDIDTIQWITGACVDHVDGAQFVESSSGTKAFSATGTLGSGAGFHVAAGWTLPDTAPPMWDLKVHCEQGVVQASWSTDGVTAFSADVALGLDAMAWPTLYGQIDGALRREIDHFAEALSEGTPFVVTEEDALAAVRSAAKLQEASVGRTVQ